MPLEGFPPRIDLNLQSVEIPGTRRPGQSGEYKSNIWPESHLTYPGRPTTLFEMFEQSVARHPNQDMSLRRPLLPSAKPSDPPTYGTKLIGTTYSTIQARRTALGSALLALERSGRLRSSVAGSVPTPVELTHSGVPHYGTHNRVKNGARRGWGVGIWMKNREEWNIVDLACQAYGLVDASLYETLGPDATEYITNHCPLSIIFASSNHLAALLKIAPKCPTLRIVVSVDPLAPAEKDVLAQWAANVNIELLDILELEAWGASEGVRCDPGPVKGVAGEYELDRDRIITISYTSGTTGNPKGVVLTNRNMTTAAIANTLGSAWIVKVEAFRYFSYMPLSHIYERFGHWVAIHGDGIIAFSTGDVTRLLEDAQVLKPVHMAGVPRVYNRINAAVVAQMNTPGLKGALLRRAVATKMANWRERAEVCHPVYDALVFRQIRNILGGRLHSITSGAAPLMPNVHEMLKICFSCDVVQGYGMTETVGTCSGGLPFDTDAVGTVGRLQPCNIAKVVDVESLGYTSKDLPNPRGELCLKGLNITPGYLHDPKNTAALIDADGWMHTGDVAEIDSVGRLKIVDRIKNVVKLSQGEYVALEKIEGVFAPDALFASLVVHADSTRSSLVALAVLDPTLAAGLVKSVLGQSVPTDIAALEKAVKDKRVSDVVLASMTNVGRQNKLNGFEMIKGVHLMMSPFPEETLTPTLKVKRAVLAKMFGKEIEAMYTDIERNDGGRVFAKL